MQRNNLSVRGDLQYTERPTITYTPLGGKDFVKSVLTPADLDTLILLTPMPFFTFILRIWNILFSYLYFVFLYSPYNMVADIKMLYFFKNIKPFAFWVLIVLFVLSIPSMNKGQKMTCI